MLEARVLCGVMTDCLYTCESAVREVLTQGSIGYFQIPPGNQLLVDLNEEEHVTSPTLAQSATCLPVFLITS